MFFGLAAFPLHCVVIHCLPPQVVPPGKLYRVPLSFISGGNVVIRDCVFQCLSSSGLMQGGAVCILLPHSHDHTISSCGFIDCASAGSGGACFLRVKSVHISRTCATRCSSGFGQFAYLDRQTHSLTSELALLQCARGGDSFAVISCNRNLSPNIQHVNVTACRVAAHGAAIYNFDSDDCGCAFLTVDACEGVTCVWADAATSLESSNFVRNSAKSSVIWAADKTVTVEKCCFVANVRADLDGLAGALAVTNCIFDSVLPDCARFGGNAVFKGIGTIAIEPFRTAGCSAAVGRRVPRASENETVALVRTAWRMVEDDTPTIIGIVFMILLIFSVTIPVLILILKYRGKV
jgi:hypothetical protein